MYEYNIAQRNWNIKIDQSVSRMSVELILMRAQINDNVN